MQTEGGTEPELTRDEAVARLGVKPATLYAYVSRGLIRRRRGRDGRSRFSLADVERLRQRGRAAVSPTSMAVRSVLTSVEPATIRFRGRDVMELVAAGTFEQSALWLWTGEQASPGEPWETDHAALATGLAVQSALPVGTLPMDRLRVTVPAIAPTDPLRYDTSQDAVEMSGRRLIAALVDSLPQVGTEPPADRSIAARLWPRLTAEAPRPPLVHLLDSALILLIDHELSLSTLSARLTASLFADPYSVVSVGLSALGGPFHAVASLPAEDLLAEVSLPQRAAWTIGERLRRGDRLPGFGHRSHTGGDPRARVLLKQLNDATGDEPPMLVAREILRTTAERGLPQPNVDFALAAFARTVGMVRGSSEAIFALARVAGWIGHALEVYTGGAEASPSFMYLETRTGPER
ncbi:MAG: citrate/2-methylcitrate synthase [Candidatus Dormibacteraceae bacterium]